MADLGSASGGSAIFSESETPDILVAPEVLTIRQPATVFSNPGPEISLESTAPDPCTGGLVVPSEVIAHWQDYIHPPQYPAPDSFPEQIDWSIFDSPVKSQGYCGSCAAFSAAALVENLIRQAGLAEEAPDLSEQVLLACTDIKCSGGWYWDALIHIKETGVPLESCYAYTSLKGNCDNACSAPDILARISRISDQYALWGMNPSVDVLREALQKGPLCVSMKVPPDGSFSGNGYAGGIYNYNGPDFPWELNGHAVLLVGYDDRTQSFKAKNSWGDGWGENGYFRIAYDDVTDDVKFGSYGCQASGIYLEGAVTTILITNQGATDLSVSAIVSSHDWLSATPATGITISPDQSQVITISVDWNQLAGLDQDGTLTIHSNDPDKPALTIQVHAETALQSSPSSPIAPKAALFTSLPNPVIPLKKEG